MKSTLSQNEQVAERASTKSLSPLTISYTFETTEQQEQQQKITATKVENLNATTIFRRGGGNANINRGTYNFLKYLVSGPDLLNAIKIFIYKSPDTDLGNRQPNFV